MNLSTLENLCQIIPNVEKTLSRLLFDVQISRRKFQPITQVEDYRGRLRKLVTTILDYKVIVIYQSK